MAEILSLLIDSISSANRVDLCILLILLLILASPLLLPLWFESDPPPIATAIMTFVVIFVCIFPINYFLYSSSEYRDKAAKLCDQIPECNFEEMYNKAKLYTKSN